MPKKGGASGRKRPQSTDNRHRRGTKRGKPRLTINDNIYPRYKQFLGACVIEIRSGDQFYEASQIIGDERIKDMISYLYSIYKKRMEPCSRHQLKKAIGISGNKSINLMIDKVNGLVKGYDNRGIKVVRKKKVQKGKRKVVVVYLETLPVLKLNASLSYLMETARTFDTTPG